MGSKSKPKWSWMNTLFRNKWFYPPYQVTLINDTGVGRAVHKFTGVILVTSHFTHCAVNSWNRTCSISFSINTSRNLCPLIFQPAIYSFTYLARCGKVKFRLVQEALWLFALKPEKIALTFFYHLENERSGLEENILILHVYQRALQGWNTGPFWTVQLIFCGWNENRILLEIAIMEDSHISDSVMTWFTEGPILPSEIGPPITDGRICSALEWDGMLLPEHTSYRQVLQSNTHLYDWWISKEQTVSWAPLRKGSIKKYQLLSGHRNTG